MLVPRDKMTRLRMKLAEGGLPKGGGVGYEIFDKSDTLGATSFVQNINHLRALEGELARTIRAIDRVQAARVHLVLPERPLFSRDKVEPSASIVLKVRGALEPQPGARDPPSRRLRGQRPEARARLDRRRGRARCSPTAPPDDDGGRRRRPRNASARYERRLREQVEVDRLVASSAPAARACSSPPTSTSTASPRRPTNSIPRAAWCAPARRARRSADERQPAKARSPSATNCPARTRPARRADAAGGRATRARSPRKSSTTRFRARPRPR